MFKLLNLVEGGSSLRGWVVDIDTKPETPVYTVSLDDGGSSGVAVLLNPDDYMDLTLPQGVNIRASTKLASIKNIDGTYKPMVKLAGENDDETIMLFNFESELGTSVISIEFENCIAINCDILKGELSDRVVLAAVGLDRTQSTGILVKYGRIGGRSLTSRILRYGPANSPSLKVDLFTDNEIVTSIESLPIIIQQIDLESLCDESDNPTEEKER